MKLHIHQNYITYTEFLQNIPQSNYETSQVFCNRRNIVEKVKIDDKVFVIKKFKKPHIINRFAYTFLRKSKARRAFEYAGKLLEKDIDTAFPVAYIEVKRGGLFHTGYFISEFLDYPLLPEAKQLDEKEAEQLKSDLLNFTVDLHNKKIIHKDYNPTNILFHKEGENYKFALIDINRLEFNSTNLTLCMQAINQLLLGLDETSDFTIKYAQLRNLNSTQCLHTLKKNRKYLEARELRKKSLKRIFK